MRRSELHYNLPPERIATAPAEPRDASRLLVLQRPSGAIEHRRFRDIAEYLRPGDCLVLNDTRVLPARLFLQRRSGGRIEALFLHLDPADRTAWRVQLRGSARLRPGERLSAVSADQRPASPPVEFELLQRCDRGAWLIRPHPAEAVPDVLARIGDTPLPPYILRARGGTAAPAEVADAERYQTVYAAVPGAVAAPTAGLHFTKALLGRLTDAGVRQAAVTLHVGPGTFQPIEVDDLSRHAMHAEWFEVDVAATAAITAARVNGGRIVAVGTTSARVLESLASIPVPEAARGTPSMPSPAGARGWTDIFIYPPYRFRNVDALLTNFHLPESTLLALVMAFASPAQVRAAYAAAIAAEYRFYSYGDAMLIL